MTNVVQLATNGAPDATFFADVTPGNLVIAIVAQRDNAASFYSGPAGFTFMGGVHGAPTGSTHRALSMWKYVVQADTTLLTIGGDSQTYRSPQASDRMSLIELDADDTGIFASGLFANSTGDLDCGGFVSPSAGDNVTLVGAWAVNGGGYSITPESGTVEYCEQFDNPFQWAGYRDIPVASGGVERVRGSSGISGGNYLGVTAVFIGPSAPVADFTSDATAINAGDTVGFIDLSTNDPTSWLWDFGDASTSTSQNPSHVYTNPGNYTVTLTATNADGSDTETKVAYISVTVDVGYVPPDPGRALVEIKAAGPGTARWGSALWGSAVWSTSSWQDVTPQSIEVSIIWGNQRPELGILGVPDADSWAISFFDPSRILDPANETSPYVGDLLPGLPVRIRHEDFVVRQGTMESLSHTSNLNERGQNGYMRVTNSQSTMANSTVPSDTALPNTLFARARAAISAAGLSLTVLPDPAGGDPDLIAWATGTERTVWEWITDAAQSVLWVPYIDRLDRLGFRAWTGPLVRGRQIEQPNLIGLSSVIFVNGLYSIVTARNAADTDDVTREVTPKPRWGARAFKRDDPTPDPEAWAQTVLDDRAQAGLRWVPGDLFSITASDVAYFAGLEAIESIHVTYDDAVPPVAFDGIIVGGLIQIEGKWQDEAVWHFALQVAQVPTQPLTDDDDVSSYLSNDDDPFDILYPG